MLGTLSEFTLAQLLQLFALSENSGTITVHAGKHHTRLLIESDRVIGLGAPEFDPRADFLRIEFLTSRSRHALQELDPRKDTPGLSLLVGNLVDPDRWNRYVSRRLEQDVYPLLNEEDGAFEITVERCPPAPVKVSASVQQLILDSTRWEAESESLQASGYNLDRIWHRAVPESRDCAIALDREQWLVWAAMVATATVADVAQRLGIPDLQAATAVCRLHEAGLVERVP